MIERMIANYNIGALWSLIYFQFLHNLFTYFLLYGHLDNLQHMTNEAPSYVNTKYICFDYKDDINMTISP